MAPQFSPDATCSEVGVDPKDQDVTSWTEADIFAASAEAEHLAARKRRHGRGLGSVSDGAGQRWSSSVLASRGVGCSLVRKCWACVTDPLQVGGRCVSNQYSPWYRWVCGPSPCELNDLFSFDLCVLASLSLPGNFR